LRTSALFFWSYSNAFIFKIPASGTDFQNTGLLLATVKIAVIPARPDLAALNYSQGEASEMVRNNMRYE